MEPEKQVESRGAEKGQEGDWVNQDVGPERDLSAAASLLGEGGWRLPWVPVSVGCVLQGGLAQVQLAPEWAPGLRPRSPGGGESWVSACHLSPVLAT